MKICMRNWIGCEFFNITCIFIFLSEVNVMSFFDGKRILVAGATGLIGSHLIKHLMGMNGVKVVALGRDETKMRQLFAEYYNNSKFSFWIHDAIKPLPNFNEPIHIIINAIGSVARAELINRPVQIMESNLISTLNFLRLLKEQKENLTVNGRMIVLSSATVYSDVVDLDKRLKEYETENTNPLSSAQSPYSETKRFLEVLATSYYKQYGVESVIVRPGYVYGFTYFSAGKALDEFIKNAIESKNITIQASILPRRDNIYVDDVIDGLLCICEHGVPGEVYNISSNGEFGNFAAVNEMAEMIAKTANALLSTSIEVEYIHKNIQLCAGILLDNNKLKALGWELKHSLSSGIVKTINTYMSELNQ